MRNMSLKRSKTEAELKKVVADIRKVRGGKCEDCGHPGLTDPSHNYCRKDYPSLISDPQNITLLCRRHHDAFQDNQLWLLKGDTILRKMKDQYENEPDVFRAKEMRSHLIGKLTHGKDNAELWGEKFPAWCDKLLDEVKFP